MLQISPNQTKKQKYAKKEVGASEFIPYLCHWDKKTILTKNKSLLQVIKVGGYSFETADDADVDIKKDIRNMLFKGLSSGSIVLYFHTFRRRTSLIADDAPPIDPNIKIPANFVDYLQQEWNKRYTTKQAFANELYVTIIRKQDTQGAAVMENIYKKFRAKADKSVWENDMREMHEDLEEITNRIVNTLNDYHPRILEVVETNKGVFCEITEFLSKTVNCGQANSMIVPTSGIDRYITTNRLFFGKKALESRGVSSRLYGGMLGIKEYGPTTNAGAFDSLLQMPFEFIMTQSFRFANRQVAINKMQLQQNRMIQAEDKAFSQISEISYALDMAMSGDIGFGDHHLSILVMDEDMKVMENNLSMASVEMFNAGLQPIRETTNLEPVFWGQLPGNEDFIIRKATINTQNLSGFASLHNFPRGKPKDNHWGNSVTVFDTTSGTPFHFNFHVRDVGHTLIIGPTGAGKTVLMNFLCAMAQKFKCRMFFFDKDRGAEIFIRAINGKYSILDPAKKCAFNPLQLPENGENKAFLLEWLKILVSINGEKITAENVTTLTQAIAGNYKLRQEDRRLRNIVPFMGIEGPGSLANRIAMWHSRGSHANIFDNEEDALDLHAYKVFGFEMAELLKDPMALLPVLNYVFHRISISLDGSPTMIVLDEAWALIDNPVFAPKIKDWLKVLRKLNTFVIFATQSVEDASKSKISDTLIQQTATQIFLPNLKATDVYKTAFMLSSREFHLIKTTDPSSRFFLIKQGTDAVVARIDLSGMTDIINVLSARSETVLLLDKIRQKVGDNPEDWLPIYYKEARNVK